MPKACRATDNVSVSQMWPAGNVFNMPDVELEGKKKKRINNKQFVFLVLKTIFKILDQKIYLKRKT